MKRTFDVVFTCSNGESETEIDVENGEFADMMNELLGVFYTIMDECNEKYAQVVAIYEVPYDGEEDE